MADPSPTGSKWKPQAGVVSAMKSVLSAKKSALGRVLDNEGIAEVDFLDPDDESEDEEVEVVEEIHVTSALRTDRESTKESRRPVPSTAVVPFRKQARGVFFRRLQCREQPHFPNSS